MLKKNLSLLNSFGPGILVCLLISALAYGLEVLEKQLFGQAWLESLVLAILLGSVTRSCFTMPTYFQKGINFCAKTLLEVAIVLLGASISIHAVLSAGWSLLASIVFVIFVTIILSFIIGRVFGLSKHLAMLVACGNAICGNSAIVAVAPVIKAKHEEIAASIAFTALLGILIILCLPFAHPFLNLSFNQYGVLAGMVVYAVPQVLAATASVSFASVQIATVVKLVRVLMLGPLIFALSLIYRRSEQIHFRWHTLVPWFIIGFIIMMLVRSSNLIPETALNPIKFIAQLFTVISMAALGLGVDIRSLKKAGWRVILASTCSIIILGICSLIMIQLNDLNHITF
ncbi:YeiH family protein [Bartonella krasnovii]|uniref:YeiH family putative sulfate export transporter n=1 Tax=Bartonella krasnovii TaxID=2267275 RepID=A0A5B9CZI5_9HYPH|nr:YeiH family protein [Bartonella krasnovii]QEE11562.1 YeiH family putative sulfate export transporter [Bartonella krasnovii]UNF40717.1 YeiH family protein [Bartonella krasnovii]UNF45637.1 YeiH family protein [Bartonella krasnovii]UNF47224.1 YeiH family protein [Bartonella krasnovii]UNF52232.1 YeiH family protein [Bartonella krasnovii]